MAAETLTENEQRRFLAKVRVGDGCWEWQATITADGYGQFAIQRRAKYAHRIAYELWVGPIPDGLQIDHLCRNRACVRPDHLEPVTCRENLLRGDTVTARNAAKTHCANGHQFTAENTYTRPDGARECRTCNRESRTEAARGR